MNFAFNEEQEELRKTVRAFLEAKSSEAAVRAAADELEGLVADDTWPLPTYQEMLHIL